jgi:ATP-dependent DNA helicase RecG
MSFRFLDSPIEYLKGVGPTKGETLKKELGVYTFSDLLYEFPFRYIDRTKFHRINELNDQLGSVQLKGFLHQLTYAGVGRKRRLSAKLKDSTGTIDLIWFSGIHWLEKTLVEGAEYIVFGKIQPFLNQFSIAHPEMELFLPEKQVGVPFLEPVYSGTEKLNSKGLDSKNRRKLIQNLFEKASLKDFPENLPPKVVEAFRFPNRFSAFQYIHLPPSMELKDQAISRFKFEELFFLQVRLFQLKSIRKKFTRGFIFEQVGPFFNEFYSNLIPFELTNAQKRVLKEIRADLKKGFQMNRLLQGDVGSGKTMVALMTILIALDNGFQTCLMAPTEILARQHFKGFSEFLAPLGIRVEFLSGSIKGKQRKVILEDLKTGVIHVVIGTHALIEPTVEFYNLGLAIIDEQHRFGVAQRARLWQKSTPCPPHVLVMTATPIPRTLAMTLYGDLDVSVIDELPPGRKDVVTLHKTENNRLRVFGFMKEQIALGRQVYVVYPLIEESEALDLQNLMQGYDAMLREFPLPQYRICVVHGKMKPEDKAQEMQSFVMGKSQIMIATTVIEVGVNVPNASVMVIENTERFGLSQLHQLRGRVGRGADQSYCILMSSFKITKEAKERIKTMVSTNNGFEIAEADLKLRGPGNIEGTQQSGILSFKLADLSHDQDILKAARRTAETIIEEDPDLEAPENHNLKTYLQEHYKNVKGWSRIS